MIWFVSSSSLYLSYLLQKCFPYSTLCFTLSSPQCRVEAFEEGCPDFDICSRVVPRF